MSMTLLAAAGAAMLTAALAVSIPVPEAAPALLTQDGSSKRRSSRRRRRRRNKQMGY